MPAVENQVRNGPAASKAAPVKLNTPPLAEPAPAREPKAWAYLIRRGESWLEKVLPESFLWTVHRKHALRIESFDEALQLAEQSEGQLWKHWTASDQAKKLNFDFQPF